MHRPAVFAALLGLTRAASAVGDFWGQNDFCAGVKGASDDAPVTYEDPATKEKTTHGTADGRKACLHHAASRGLKCRVDTAGARFSQLSGTTRPVLGARQVSWTEAA
ncbi:hypothetical protein [Streptomyces olivaceus]|uniref:hypothetical protein n=1 Tax=Streptomyces olivaceus TaxID=47716 RepID=UPI001CCA6E8D|nr:hypothetical protein [Streptomyces olivaceus]